MLERLRDFLTSRRLLIVLTVLVGVVGVLYLLFASLIFDPFEDDLEDLASIVPRDVEYFMRWQDAGSRFSSFPEPAIWSDLQATEVYAELEEGGGLEAWEERLGIGAALAELGTMSQAVPTGLSLKDDFLREVAIAGKGEPGLGRDFDGVLMLRVSFKVKAGVALLDFDFVRDKLPAEVGIVSEGDFYRLPGFFEGKDAWLARNRDVVLLASDSSWLETAQQLQLKKGQDSLALASVFHDNVTAYLGELDEPVEVFLRWERLRRVLPGFPPEGGEPNFPTRAFAAFFTTDLLRTASGYWLPGKRFQVRLSGAVDVSQARSTFQENWLESSKVSINRIRDFAGLVPSDSFFFAGFAGRTDEVLIELEGALDSELRRLLDEIATNTGRYNGMVDLLRSLALHFQPGIFVAMRRNDYPAKTGDNAIEHDGAPVPAIAILAKASSSSAYEDLQSMIARDVSRMIGGEVRQWNLDLSGGAQGKSFSSPAISGTGEIILAEIPALDAVMICNHWDYATEISRLSMLTVAGDRNRDKLTSSDAFREALDSVEAGASIFTWFEPSEAQPWFDELGQSVAEQQFKDWMDQQYASQRPDIEQRLKQELFATSGRLSSSQQAQLDDEVDAALAELAADQRAERLPGLEADFHQGLLPLQWLDWVSITLEASRKDASILADGALELD